MNSRLAPIPTHFPIGYDVADPELIDPLREHDDLPIEDLVERYNFKKTREVHSVLCKLLMREMKSASSPIRVLDIGCGAGIAERPGYNRLLRPLIDDYWGVEPDETIHPPPNIFDCVKHDLLEDADLPENYFNFAYTINVMEHIPNPTTYLKTVSRVLAPGGAFFFLTPNGSHYFTTCAKVANSMHLINPIRWRLKGRTEFAARYPVFYRFNKAPAIAACAQEAGLLPPQLAYCEHQGPRGYFKGPLKPVLWAGNLKRTVWHRRESLLQILGRIQKPA